MSKVVDQKIVEMRFDNSRFEKNVQTTLSTLDRLKRSLKFDGATNGLENLGKAANSISLNGLSSGVEALQRRFSTLGIVSMRIIERMTDSVIDFGRKLTGYVTNGVIQGGINRAMNIENAHFQLQGLLKDEEAVQAIMNDAMDSVNDTAYAYDSAAKAAAQFAASGLRSGEKMQSSLRAITGVAAMTNSEYEDISRIFTTVSGNGRVMGEQLLQLSSRGLNAAATLADYLGKTESEVRSMVSDGQISFDIFAAAMDDAFGAHAKKANETFTGAMSNIRAALAKIGADFVSPLLVQNGPLVNLLNTVRMKINDVRKAIAPLAASFVDLATKAIKALTSFLSNLNVTSMVESFINFINNAGKTLSTFYGKLKESGVLDGFIDLLKRASRIVGVFTESFKQFRLMDRFTDAIITVSNVVIRFFNVLSTKLAESGVVKKFTDLLGKFGDTVSKVFNILSAEFKKIDWIEKFTDIIVKASTSVVDFLDSFTANSKWNKFTDQLSQAGISVNDFQEKLKETARENGITIDEILQKEGSLTTAFKNKTVSTDLVIDTLKKYSDAQLSNIGYTEEQIVKIKELAEEARKTGTPVNELIDSLSRPSKGELLIETAKNVFGSIKTVIKTISEAWSEIFTNTKSADILYTFIETIRDLSSHLVISEESVDKLKRTFKGLFTVIDMVSTIARSGFKFLLELVQEVLKAFGMLDVDILSITANIGDAIVEFRAWANEHGVITKAIKTVLPVVAEFIAKIASLVKKIYELPIVQNVIKRVFDILTDVFLNVSKYLTEGLDQISLFIDHMKEFDEFSLENVKKALVDFKETVIDHFINFDAMKEIGLNIVQGLSIGLKEGTEIVVNSIIEVASALLKGIMEFLGIHSPSLKFMEIGEYIIAGLVNGIRNGLSTIFGVVFEAGGLLVDGFVNGIRITLTAISDIIREIYNVISSTISQLDFDKIFVGGFLVGVLVIVNKLTNAFDKLVTPLDSLNGIFKSVSGFIDGLKDSISNLADAKSLETKSKAMLNMAKAIGLLVIAIFAISKFENEDLIKGLAVVAGLAAGLALIMKATSKLENGTDFGKVSSLLMGLSGSILILSGVIKILSSIDFWEGMSAIGQITLLIGGLIALIAAYGKLVKGKAAENADQMGKMLRKMAVSIGLLAVVMKLLATMSAGDIAKGLVTIGLLEALFAGFVYVSQYAGKHGSKAGGMLLKMSGAMLILAGVVAVVSRMKPETINKGLAFIAKAEILFAAMVAVSKYAGEHGSKAGGMLLKMSGAMLILVGVIATVSFMSADSINKGLAFIAKAELLFAAVVAVSKFAGEHGSKAGGMLLKMSGAMLVLVGVVAVISVMSPEDVDKGILFIAKTEILFGMLIAISKFAGEHADKAGNMLLKMTIPITVLAIAIAALSYLDTDKVMKASEALALVIGAFSILIASTSKVQKAAGTIILLTATMAAIGGVLYMLQGLPVHSTLANATALSEVLLAISAAILILSKASPVNASALASVGVLTAVMGALAYILYKIQDINVESTLVNATALSEVLLAITLAVNILSKAHGVSASAMQSVALLTGAVAAIAFILYQIQDLPVDSTLINATALSEVLLAITAATMILGKFGRGSFTAAVEGAAALDAVIVIIGGLFTTIGGLVTLIPALEEFLDKGIVILDKIGHGIGSFVGNIAGGFIEGVSDSLPGIADNLSDFMMHLQPFISGANQITESSMIGVKMLSEMLLTLTEANLLDSITRFITGGRNLEDFAKTLIPFGEAMVKFSNTVKGGIDQAAVAAVANAGMMMVELQNALPKTDGWLQNIVGVESLKTFGNQLYYFGIAISSFSKQVSGENQIDENAIGMVSKAGLLMTDLQNALPRTDGWIQNIVGVESLKTFGNQIKAFGSAIVEFSKTITENGGINQNAVQAATNAGKIVSELYGYLGEEDSILDKIFGTGKKSVETFANELGQFGSGIKGYYYEIQNVNSEKIINVTEAINPLISMIHKMDGLSEDGPKSFTSAINKLATANVKGFLETYGASSAKLLQVGKTMSDTIAIGIKGQKEALNSAASECVSSIIQTINNAKNRFETTGKSAITSFRNGMVAINNDITATMGSILNAVVTTIRNYYNSFYSAGVYAGSGFANGLSANQTPAINSAISIATAALNALKNRLREHSPSKETYDIGDYAGAGFVNALLDTVPGAYRAGTDVADSAMGGLRRAMSKVQSIVNGNMDMQPTIRPVLDLSSVSAGAGTINDMFGVNPSVGVLANIGSINRMMGKNQANKNSEVVSAIDKLRGDLGNLNNATYNINGITYGEGSDVSEAIKTLVRAAKVERRS